MWTCVNMERPSDNPVRCECPFRIFVRQILCDHFLTKVRCDSQRAKVCALEQIQTAAKLNKPPIRSRRKVHILNKQIPLNTHQEND